MAHSAVLTGPRAAQPHTPTAALGGRELYRLITRRKRLIVVAMSVVLLISVLADVALGPSGMTLPEVVMTILAPDWAEASRRVIVWEIRLPMALMAVVVGASLSVAGAEMQTILNNPLASPFTLGVSAAAGFGAALALVLGLSLIPVGGIFFVAGNAFVCALLAALAIHACSLMRGVSAETMVLLGIALVFLFNALLAMLQYVASEQALQQVVFWTLGSMSRADWPKLGLTTVVLLGILPLFPRWAWQLTALRLGDEWALSLGVPVRRIRLGVLLGVSLLAATPVAFVGTIGFVGLVGPHVARMLVGEDQRYFLPTSALTGAVLLSATSIVSKSIIPGVIIPIGIITALIGVPFFLGLIFSRRRRLWS